MAVPAAAATPAAVAVVPSAPGSEATYTTYTVYGAPFVLKRRYSLIKPIGVGAYGIVCAAVDHTTNEKVAIKKITGCFEHLTDSKRTLREIKILRHFDHENIISIRDILKPPSYTSFDDLYVVSELMDTDLYQILSSPQALSDDHAEYFLYQLLRGMKYIHSAHIIHRDLKPNNLLVNSNCDLKVCDFGLARLAAGPEEESAGVLTEYVATRWYRAPEIMLSWHRYTEAVDVWSIGCIFAELIGRKPLFPGKDYIQQLNLIIDVLGSPRPEEIAKIQNDHARRYVESLGKKPKVPFSELFPNAGEDALDLLDKLLTFDPDNRITVDEALRHPYLEALHDPEDEPICTATFDFTFEDQDYNRHQIKEEIFHELSFYHPEVTKERKEPYGKIPPKDSPVEVKK